MSEARSIVAALFTAAATMLGAAALGACATSAPEPTEACAKAVDRLTNECNFTVDGTDAGTQFNCTGAAACAADCLYNAPCDDIRKNTPAFRSCTNACAQ